MLVFLSHSTKPDTPRDKEYLDAVEAALSAEADKFQVLLDRKSLEGGQEWPRELAEYMAKCHAAVILFSRNALKRSNWVLKESLILSWRRSLEPNFLLLPVVLDGVRQAEVLEDPRYAASELSQWQFLKPGTPEEVAARVVARCRQYAPRPNSTPMERLIVRLTGIIEKLSRAELESAAQRLGHSYIEGDPRVSRTLAYEFARRLVRSELGDLHEWVKELAQSLGRTQATRLIKELKALWVDDAAAARIPPATARGQPWVIGLNGAKLPEFSARCYLDRAFWNDPSVHLLPVDSAGGQLPVEAFSLQIRGYFVNLGLEEHEQDQFLSMTSERFFVLLPGPIPDKDILEQLQERFPHLGFLVTTGTAGHEDPRRAEHHRLLCLEPCLDLKMEQKAWVFHKSLELMLKNLAG